MQSRRFGVVCSLSVISAVPAYAEPTTLTVTGNVTSITTVQHSSVVANPSGAFGVGDPYTLTATFDFSTAQLSSYFDADPTINIYYLPGTTVSYKIGGYSRTFTQDYGSGASLQLWNNYSYTDSQTFSFFDYNMSAVQAPFNLSPNPQSIVMQVGNFDFTALARTNDLITQIAPFSAFNDKLFSFFQNDPVTDTGVLAYLSISGEYLGSAPPDTDPPPETSPAPEPGTWAMMVVGLGGLGCAMRRRQKATMRASYAL